ncbi:MAG: hypothetical protein HYZ57_07745, partial [Acidobacteria bacterium]|nr:hypothetical protein [Acidobacteriota bacterium]
MKIALLLILFLPVHAIAQTRAQELERQRVEYQKQLAPEKATRVEELLRRLKDEKILERINYGYNGLSAKVGGMVSGGGFALGPQYFRDDLKDGALVVRAAAQISFRNYQKAEAQLVLPKLAGGTMYFDLRATHLNYPGINYYGPGPDSARLRTNYRLEDTAVDGALGVTPSRFVRLGGGAGLLAVNVGPGRDSRFVSAEAVFTPAQAPGIDRQTDFFRYG